MPPVRRLHLDPVRRSSAPVRAIRSLPDDAFQAELIGGQEELLAALADVLRVDDPLELRALQLFLQSGLPLQ